MTIKEKATSSSPFKSHEWQEGYGLYETGFVKGAEWMIVRATAWLVEQGFGTNDGVVTICVKDFVKAMEE